MAWGCAACRCCGGWAICDGARCAAPGCGPRETADEGGICGPGWPMPVRRGAAAPMPLGGCTRGAAGDDAAAGDMPCPTGAWPAGPWATGADADAGCQGAASAWAWAPCAFGKAERAVWPAVARLAMAWAAVISVLPGVPAAALEAACGLMDCWVAAWPAWTDGAAAVYPPGYATD